MVEADLRYWRAIGEVRRATVREFVSRVEKYDEMTQTTAGLLYPTMGL
jgi:hypothetical protein